MIEIIELTKKIGDKNILNGINLLVEKGEIISILGANGAGKSTMLKILAGLVKPSAGEVRMDGYTLKKELIQIKRKVGYLAHQPFIYEHLTPLENLLFFAELYQVNDKEKIVKQLINEVGLGFFMHDPVRSFSRGMLQRLAIARAIVHSPSILLLDEPHTGLDQQGIYLLNRILMQMKEKGVTMLLVTHDFHQAVELSNRFIFLQQGRIVNHFQNEDQNVDLVLQQYSSMGIGL